MRKVILFCFIVLLTLTLRHQSFAQGASGGQASTPAQDETQAPAVHYYHLDFVVDELGSDGKPVNSRTYTTTVNTDAHSTTSIRTGSRIPIVTGSYGGGGEGKASALVNTQFQYQDVGINIDVRHVHEVARQLGLDVTADLTGVAPGTDPNLHYPVIRQNRWQASVLIPVGKPSVVFTSDSLDSKGSMRVLVTATPIQ
jgi:hypothetical protein